MLRVMLGDQHVHLMIDGLIDGGLFHNAHEFFDVDDAVIVLVEFLDHRGELVITQHFTQLSSDATKVLVGDSTGTCVQTDR